MRQVMDLLIVALVMSNLMMLGTSRLLVCIRLLAVQGFILGALPLVAAQSGTAGHALLIATGSILLRGIAFPWVLLRVVYHTGVRRDLEPLVGYIPSVLAGVGAMVLSIWVAAQLPLPGTPPSPLLLPAGLATFLVGLFLITGRKKAITQVVGYLVMENGIYMLGVRLLPEAPLLVELGVVLDAFVAAFVMSLATRRISRTFDHMNVDELSSLKG